MKKIICLSTFFVVALSVMAAGTVENRGVYATNPNNGFGREATITIDGKCTDWTTDMLVAQGSANDMCTAFKGSHENCVLDAYALYAAWDDANLYLAWQMVNTNDVWAREGDGPLSDGGRIGDVPLQLAISIDPTKQMTGRLVGGNMLWDKIDVVYETPIDHIFMMSGKAGLGTPAMFLPADAAGNTSYDAAYCKNFSTNGITYAMGETFLGNNLLYLNAPGAPEDVYSSASQWFNLLDANSWKGKTHNTKYDSFYEIKIPFEALGITKNYLQTEGVGVMLVATRGESGIDCLPHDPSMLDHVYDDYIHDKSTSGEKSDSDTIRCQLADVGCRRADSEAAQAPAVFVSAPDNYTFHADALNLSLRLKNATQGTYSIDGAAPVAFNDMVAITVGQNAAVGSDIQLTVTATFAEQTTTETYTYHKAEGFALAPGTAIVVKPEDWASVSCYMYAGGEKQNAKWPGVDMQLVRDNFYALTMPKGWTEANVIFNNKLEDDAKEQYPKEGGLQLKAGEVKLWDWTAWYNVANTPATGLTDVMTSQNITAFALGNVLYISSDKEQSCNIYSIGGQFVTQVDLSIGTTEIIGLTQGVYIVANQKVIVR